jgi:CRISPR-associated protein (TIGR03984 family)
MSEVKVAEVFLAFEPVLLPGGDLRDALHACWNGGDAWVLGHAFDGVLWGALRGGRLLLPPEELRPPALRVETLTDLKVFNEEEELRVWRAQGRLAACAVREAARGERFDAVQERAYELLRARPDAHMERGPFVELRGAAGQRHTPPGDETRPERLCVRHYLRAYDETGLLTMAEHRLLGIKGEDW